MLLQPSWHDVIPAAVTADQAATRPTPTDLEELQQNLKSGWTVHVAQDGRLYYCNHLTQTSSWLPPVETWAETGGGFPYGWEEATDSDGKPYFINESVKVQLNDVKYAMFKVKDIFLKPVKSIAGKPVWCDCVDVTVGIGSTHMVMSRVDGVKRQPCANQNAFRHFFLHRPSHLNKTTTYEDPRKDWTEEPPQPRQVELARHPELGFGFVAGSEKPVIVRFVTEGGPSVDKLQPGDQILSINGEDVKKAPRDHVIQLVRSCKETVRLTVCQPPLDNSARKSALLSAAKKAKLKSNPSRVRFAEGVVVNGSPLFPPSTFSLGDSSVPFMPNVLKVFLENGQTKSFKYDSNTTVHDVMESLQQKLCIKAVEHFSLVVEHVKSLRRNKLTLLDPQEPLARIAARPGSHNLRCLFRVAFVPRDACDLAQKDLVAFEYLYMQCCNDVVQERYAPELKYDIALRLAALHIHQHAISNNMTSKVTVKAIEQEFGLERFVPVSLMSTMKRKELRKLIGHFLKLNHNLSPTGQKSLTSLQAKLYYLNIISELPSYGAKCFSTNIRDSNMERVILVSPKFGISQIAGLRNSVPVPLADIEQMSLVTVTREDELSRCVRIYLPTSDERGMVLSMEDRDAEELVLVLQGYYRLLTGRILSVEQDRDLSWTDDAAPPYHSHHQVLSARWSYTGRVTGKHYATFSMPPPCQPIHVKSNGHIPASPNKSVPLDTNSRPSFGVDSNMNTMTGLLNGNTKARDCNGYLENNRCAVVTQKLLDLSSATYDLQSVVSMEILESDLAYVEARNEEVFRRVAEMQELVQNSEQYLTQQQQQQHQHLGQQHHQQLGKEESDSEGSHISSVDSDAPGQLKHSDSLLLLTQGQKLVSEAVNDAVLGIDLGDNEPSESDTDSMSTPTSSPSHRPGTGKEHSGSFNGSSVLDTSGSSFGLHSPDSLLPVGFCPSDHNIQDLLKKLQEGSSLPYDFAEGTLYLDPDIIDLTMIPPPITPDEDGLYALPPQLSLPPTPFADHSPLEMELQSRTEQLINHKNIISSCALDLEQDSLLDELLGLDLNKTLSSDEPHAWVLPGLDMNLDFEAFLATVTVPPPTQQAPPSVELTPEEISSFIIPPPPAIGNDSLNGELNSTHVSTVENHDKKTGNMHSSSRVIEYATVNRKGGTFSCCGKYRDSPDKSQAEEIQPPPRCGSESLKPPARPPKSAEHLQAVSVNQQSNSVSGGHHDSQPPLLPPRSDSINHHSWLSQKKPPLPPVPSQDVLRRSTQHNTCPKGLADGNSPSKPGSGTMLRNGHIFSDSSVSSKHGREALCSRSDMTMVGLLERLDQVVAQCSRAQAAGGGAQMDETRFQAAKEVLTNEARQLVTASKLLVKSSTDTATRQELPSNLASCLQLLHRLTELAADMTVHTTAPLQTRNLVLKVRDVACVFRETLTSILDLDVQEGILLQRAEGLANVLATLLRSLRVFSP